MGLHKTIDKFLSEKGIKDICIVVDEGVRKTSLYKGFQEKVDKSSGLVHEVVARGTEEPDYDYLDQIVNEAKKKRFNYLIGVGGGSTLDITKGVSVLLTNPGKGVEYRGFDKVKNQGIPVIAIPTTAGTGSEVTPNAVFTDKKEMRKLGINGKFMKAKYVILDPMWTLSCPEEVSVSAGMDAMTHTLESFVCKRSNRLTKMFAKEAFSLLYHALPSIIDEPKNIEKRSRLLLGSYLAAISLCNSGSGVAAAMSYPLGVYYKIPHGIGGGIFVTHIAEYNVNNNYYDYAELYDLIKNCTLNMPAKEKAVKFVQRMYQLTEKLRVPKVLDEYGINKENIEEVAELLRPLQVAFDQNPTQFSYFEAKALLHKLTN